MTATTKNAPPRYTRKNMTGLPSDWLSARLIGCLIGCLIGRPIDCLIGCPQGWLVNCVIGSPIRSTESETDVKSGLYYWLIDWRREERKKLQCWIEERERGEGERERWRIWWWRWLSNDVTRLWRLSLAQNVSNLREINKRYSDIICLQDFLVNISITRRPRQARLRLKH